MGRTHVHRDVDGADTVEQDPLGVATMSVWTKRVTKGLANSE